METAKEISPDWPFLIKESYQFDNLIKLFKEISKDNIGYFFNVYEEIIEQYKHDNVTCRYFDLIQ